MEMTRELVEEFIKKCATFVGKDYDNEWHRCTNELYEMGYRNPEFIENPINWPSYHSDWNSIMEVVEKIESLGVNFKINTQWNPFSECNYTHVSVTKVKGELSKDRKAMYNSVKVYEKNSETLRIKKQAVIQSIDQFIDWYNTQK